MNDLIKRPPPGRKSRAGLLKEIERLQARVEELEAKLYRKDERIKAWKQSSDDYEARVEALEVMNAKEMEYSSELEERLLRLEGDLNIMRLQRNAKHCSRCPECAKEFVYSYGTNTAATEQEARDE